MITIGKATIYNMDCTELDKDYFDASIKRIRQATAQERLFA